MHKRGAGTRRFVNVKLDRKKLKLFIAAKIAIKAGVFLYCLQGHAATILLGSPCSFLFAVNPAPVEGWTRDSVRDLTRAHLGVELPERPSGAIRRGWDLLVGKLSERLDRDRREWLESGKLTGDEYRNLSAIGDASLIQSLIGRQVDAALIRANRTQGSASFGNLEHLAYESGTLISFDGRSAVIRLSTGELREIHRYRPNSASPEGNLVLRETRRDEYTGSQSFLGKIVTARRFLSERAEERTEYFGDGSQQRVREVTEARVEAPISGLVIEQTPQGLTLLQANGKTERLQRPAEQEGFLQVSLYSSEGIPFKGTVESHVIQGDASSEASELRKRYASLEGRMVRFTQGQGYWEGRVLSFDGRVLDLKLEDGRIVHYPVGDGDSLSLKPWSSAKVWVANTIHGRGTLYEAGKTQFLGEIVEVTVFNYQRYPAPSGERPAYGAKEHETVSGVVVEQGDTYLSIRESNGNIRRLEPQGYNIRRHSSVPERGMLIVRSSGLILP